MSRFKLRGDRLIVACAFVMLVFALPACGSSEDGAEQGQSGSGDGQATQPASQEQTTSASGDETTGGETTMGGQAMEEVRDGTWQVDEAGTVEFRFADNSIELQDVSPNSGWDQRIAAQSADELEVHLTRDDTDWKFEVEVDGERAEISRERDTQAADAGIYQVGDAAEVRFGSEDGSLSVDSVDTANGWEVTKRDESSDDIEIDFAKGNATAEFEAEQSSGRTGLEISQKVSGPIPN